MIKFKETIELSDEAAQFYKEAAAMSDDTISVYNLFEIILEKHAQENLKKNEGERIKWNSLL